MTETADRARVRRAARSVGRAVGIACAAITLVGTLILIATVALGSHREGEQGHDEGGGDFTAPNGDTHWVIDSWKLVAIIVALAIVGVALLWLVGWFAARRAVAPLAEALRAQRNFVADASHELRTPLTVLDARIQLLQRRIERDGPAAATLEQLRGDAAMMREVLDDLLLAAEQAERGDAEAPVAATVLAAVDSLRPLAEAARVVLAAEVAAAPAMAVIPVVPLSRCVVALVDNAIQHSPEDAAVEVTAAAEPGFAVIRVRDHGDGITGLAPERVFERFARGPEHGRRRGFGLGLSLVRDVATRFGGSVRVESSTPAGTCFVLRVPVAG